MATNRAPVLSDKDERAMSKLRNRLFESNWDSAEFKASVRDLSPSEVYNEEAGFKMYVGNCNHASDLIQLEVKHISFILNMAAGESTCQMTAEVYGESYKVMRVCAGDIPGYNMSQHFRETFDFIEEARRENGRVLVHCSAGVSRSCTISIAYLMQLHGWSLERAGSHVRKRRANVFPNLGFMKQLRELEKRLGGKSIISKSEKHSPDKAPCSMS